MIREIKADLTAKFGNIFAARFFITLVILFGIGIPMARANQITGQLGDPGWQPKPGILLSQASGTDTYDPFADYSEFEESAEEEADINFFRNGRFFTIGFLVGYRMWTETLGDLYQDTTNFGLYISYFFDMRFALQMSFLTGDHQLRFSSPQGTNVRGNAAITAIGLDLKYYINTQNVTRGLAALNPYLIFGFSQVYRTATVAGESAFAKEGALGFDLGSGIEIPLLRNKMYFGGQLMYQLVNFKDENSEIVLSQGGERTNIYPTGDNLTGLAILGVNF